MLREADLVKLKEHSKLHKGGMSSKHIKNMKKFMTNGDSFSVAHQKAIELDKKIDKKIVKPKANKQGNTKTKPNPKKANKRSNTMNRPRRMGGY